MSATLGGRYQLVRELGAGAMGRVFQALDLETGRAVALKLLLAGEDNLDALLRFQQEGAVLSTLKHPNIVEVYGAILDAEQHTSCIIMELLEGQSLGRMLSRETLTLDRVARLAGQVAAALTYAHGRGIIHRDIKPDNIMIVGDDRVKVTDFGIARILRTGATLNTATGMSIGTPLYMSPEQIEGRRIDGRSDIYSVGAVLYQMVTGRPPFEGDDPLTVAFKHVHKAPQLPEDVAADLPPEWEAVIMKCLAKDPSDRFQTASVLEEAIASLRTDGRSPARESRPPDPSRSPAILATPSADPPATAATSDRFWDPPLTNQISEEVPLRSPELTALVGTQAGESAPLSAPARAVDTPETDRKTDRRLPLLIGAGAVAVVILAGVVVVVALLTRPSGSSATGSNPTASPSGASLTQITQWGSSGSGAGQFRAPQGVAVDSRGNIFVADTGNDRIQSLAATTDPMGTWGTQGAELGQFDSPAAVALDGRGDILVADTDNNRIQKLSPSGRLMDAWGSEGSGSGEFEHPTGIALDGAGNVYVADTGNNRIQKLSATGTPIASWGSLGAGPGQFSHPGGIAVNGRGDILVADTGNNRIQELASTSDPLAQWGSKGSGHLEFSSPRGVAVDSRDSVYVADTGNNRVQKLDANGHFAFAAGTAGSGPGEFRHPTSIVVNSAGHIYVVDTGNDRVQELSAH